MTKSGVPELEGPRSAVPACLHDSLNAAASGNFWLVHCNIIHKRRQYFESGLKEGRNYAGIPAWKAAPGRGLKAFQN
jgi:hypothetical protein